MKSTKLTAMFLVLALLPGCAMARRHPTRMKFLGLAVGAGIGLVAGLATRGSHCPPTYDGTPYDGTSPCPKDEK
jgi:hypothetical protein